MGILFGDEILTQFMISFILLMATKAVSLHFAFFLLYLNNPSMLYPTKLHVFTLFM